MKEHLLELLKNYNESLVVIRSGTLFAFEPPQAKQSARFGGGRAWTDPKKVKYVKALADAFREGYPTDALPIVGMVRLTILYCFPWPQKERAMEALGWTLTDKRIDLDNLLKPVKDSLNGVCFHDDSQVVDVRARKIRFKVGCIAIQVDEVRPRR